MNESDEHKTEDRSQETAATSNEAKSRRQHGQVLTPLFVLGFGLMALGFYLGMSEDVELSKAAGSEVEISEAEALEMAPSADSERATLVYRPSDERTYVLSLNQKSTRRFLRGESELFETEIVLEVEEGATKAEETDNILVERHFRAADVDVESAGQPIGHEITTQVESLLVGSAIRSVVQPNGKPVDFGWQDVSNPQVRRALLLIRDAHRFTVPRFRRDAINLGETWSYTLETAVENPERGLVVRGEVDVANKLLSFEERGGRTIAVIEQDYNASSSGTIDLVEGGETPFDLEGSGSGVIRFDVEGGFVHTADIEIERVLTVVQGDGEIDQTSKIDLELRPLRE